MMPGVSHGFLLLAALLLHSAACQYTHDVCSYIQFDPMWSSTHYMPTVLERTIKRKGGKLGPFHCPVCGSAHAYAADWDPNALRETGRCAACIWSTQRARQAQVLHLWRVKPPQTAGLRGQPCGQRMGRTPRFQHCGSRFPQHVHLQHRGTGCSLSLLHTLGKTHQVEGAIHAFLSDSPSYVASSFFGDSLDPGALVDGLRHEDLQRLSFANDSFDLVLSAEVRWWTA